MQKRAFLAVVGVSIVVTAVSLGFSASRFLSARYSVPAPAAPARGAAAEPSGAQALSPEKWTNLFAPDQGMDLPSRLIGKSKPQELPSTKYVLLGTVASDSRSARRAILWADGMKTPRMERESAELEAGVRLSRIERDHVFLSRGKVEERLDILPVGSRTRVTAPPAAPAASASAPRAADLPAGGEIRVTKLGESSFALDEATAGQLTGNINQYMTNVRLIPFFEGNKSAGYRVAAVRPGSAFEQLGFKNGDVIQQINNVELSTPDKMYTIFQNLKDEKRVTVNILRQGQKSTITYEIR
ncbi:MAG: PDZ domain-containing protein [Deltaproteobacteria bacterium]|nr:PDZ domain-containing protein [Deltaproteobacteria bacterium]